MTGRRRFFPSRPAQTVPGRTVELELRLQPGGGATGAVAGSGTGPSAGVALFPAMEESFHMAESGMRLQPWLQVPTFDEWRLTRAYVSILSSGETVFDAVVIGQAGAVTWTWSLNQPDEFPPYNYHDPEDIGPVSWEGVDVVQRDSTLRIRIKLGELPLSGPAWWATLTCVASVGGEVVGQIMLRPGFLLNLYVPPIE